MQVNYTKEFLKNYRQRIKPNIKLKGQFLTRLELFKKDQTHPLLRDHQLTGAKSDYRAFSITGDIRVIYKIFGDQILFYDIGTHNQVY